MEPSPVHTAAPDPLFPGNVTLPLCEVGGVQYPIDHRPGNLRPFIATLAVTAPPTAKHHTTSTRNSTTTITGPNRDGSEESDKISDTTTDT